jgi:hypothetical protein
MIHLIEYKLFEKRETFVSKKIQLLKDLALDLEDEGLIVNVNSGINDDKNYIYLSIYSNNWDSNMPPLFDSEIIKDFKETLKSYGMNPRSIVGGHGHLIFPNQCILKFDKHSKMTRSPLFYKQKNI